VSKGQRVTVGTSDDPSHDGGGSPSESVFERVRTVIDAIRPAVQSDGGDLELVEVTGEGEVRIRFLGACVGCPSSEMTLRMGVEHNLRKHVPEVTAVEAVA